MAIPPKEDNQWYFERLSKLSRNEVFKMTLLEFLDRNRNNKKVLKRFYKANNNYSIKELIVFLIFFVMVELLFPYSNTFNFIGVEPVPWLNVFFSLFVSFVSYVMISALVRIDFSEDLSEFGMDSIYKELRGEVLHSTNVLKYYQFRIYPTFLKLEFDNLVDWFTAGNLFEE